MANTPAASSSRLVWIDTMKGVSIIWVAFFHFFSFYDSGRYPWPLGPEQLLEFVSNCAPQTILERVGCFIEGVLAGLFQRGPQAVGVFLVLSGFSLSLSMFKSAAPRQDWISWYRRRLLRLFPMYWIGHLVYLVSPFVNRRDAIDYRFALSLLGDRVVPVDTMFFYLNPSWWFFGLLLELYIVYPLLYRGIKRFGPAIFLVICGIVTVVSRYLIFGVLEASGNYVMGAFFGCRLFEFAVGMALAAIFCTKPAEAERRLFSWPALAAGILLYLLGGESYRPGFTYAFTDGLIGIGLFIIMAHAARLFGRMASAGPLLALAGVYSYGLYLLHHPYVMFFGERLRGQPMTIFLCTAVGLIAIITACSITIERGVNRVAAKILG